MTMIVEVLTDASYRLLLVGLLLAIVLTSAAKRRSPQAAPLTHMDYSPSHTRSSWKDHAPDTPPSQREV